MHPAYHSMMTKPEDHVAVALMEHPGQEMEKVKR